jgi:hypothetical protein
MRHAKGEPAYPSTHTTALRCRLFDLPAGVRYIGQPSTPGDIGEIATTGVKISTRSGYTGVARSRSEDIAGCALGIETRLD